MCGSYGGLAVGALNISNNISGITTGPQGGFQECGAAIISQNLGASQTKRALDTFKRTVVVNVTIGFVGLATTLIFLEPITYVFAKNSRWF